MKIAVVGGGPAGSRAGELLSRHGAEVLVYEARVGWEKPCGGGVPERGVDFCPTLADTALTQRRALSARIISPRGREALIPLAEPLRVFSRSQLNAHLLNRAEAAGAEVIPSRVTSLYRDNSAWVIRDVSGRSWRADFLVGADGASGMVRRRVGKPLPFLTGSVGVGYYLGGYSSEEIILKFFDSLGGYLWVFPRLDHLAAGICGSPQESRSGELISRLEKFLIDFYGVGILRGAKRYGALIPFPPTAESSRDACLGEGWALVGDAAGFVDPLTREGIHYAIASSSLLAEALAKGDPRDYPRKWDAAFGKELRWAAGKSDLFFSTRFIEAFTLVSAASPSVGRIVSELIAGRQEYRRLRGTLTALAPSAGIALAWFLIKRLSSRSATTHRPSWFTASSTPPLSAPSRGTPSTDR
jgi:flavin-dependent dehydrogenase